MYAVVEKYIDDLNEMADEMTGDQVEFQDEESCLKARDQALEWLNNIFAEYDWSEEFVISYAVYCNFYLMKGLYNVIGDDYNLEWLYELNDFDDDDKQYLEYIYRGIEEQDEQFFLDVIEMRLYDFDIPKYYIYLINFLEICFADDNDFETEKGRQYIYRCYLSMKGMEKNISGELKENIVPRRVSFDEEKMVASDYSILLPQIYISNPVRKLGIAASSDLDFLSDLSGVNINDAKGVFEACRKAQELPFQEQIYFDVELNELIGRIKNMSKIEEMEREYDREYDITIPIQRREFLNLPGFVNENKYRNVAMAKQLALNYEKDMLIRKNERMVEDYAHSVENIIKPALIAEVAECLRGDENNREIYNKILNVYFNEVITQNECRLLKMVHNDRTAREIIRTNIQNAKKIDSGNGVTLRGLVDNALKQICLQLCEDGKKARFMFIMKKMMTVGVTTELINDALWQESKKSGFIYKLFSEKFNLQIHISEEAEEVYLNEEEIGTSFLYTRIVELMTNAFTYGSYDKNCRFELNIFTDKLSVSKYLIIEMINKIGDRSYRRGGVGNGLNATKAMLEKINRKNDAIDFMNVEENEEGEYSTKLYIDAALYM